MVNTRFSHDLVRFIRCNSASPTSKGEQLTAGSALTNVSGKMHAKDSRDVMVWPDGQSLPF